MAHRLLALRRLVVADSRLQSQKLGAFEKKAPA
jgi:hypothetical protein